MARSRRGRGLGSLSSGEIRGTLGTLLRTTLAQAGAVKDALERGAREGRARLDDARLGRRHEEALAELGAIVLEQVRKGELADLEEIREIAEAIAAIEQIESRLDERTEPAPRRAREAAPARRREPADDGTVSSGTWTPPQPQGGSVRVWRPSAPPEDVTEDLGPRRARATHIDEEPGAELREDRRPRRGGISFERHDDTAPDPDDDLAEYMHPDDVPSKK
jgi:hypothetical protein